MLGLYALVGRRRTYLMLYLVNMCCNILLVMALFMCVGICLCKCMDGGEIISNRSDRL